MNIRIEVISGPMDGQNFSFTKSVTIGRDTKSEIPLPLDKFVSRAHARILVAEPECFLEDLNSTNGTFVGGKQLKGRTVLDRGGQFKVGKTWLEIIW